jgi:shikimate dehydrogenase
MKLGLLGYPINHSKSPELYQRFLQSRLTSYDLISFEREELIPDLEFFRSRLDGLNITSPYKEHFVSLIEIPSPLVRALGAVNTLAFLENRTLGTNTDLVAIVEILKNYQRQYGELLILLLGDGVMARVTRLVARDLQIPLKQFSRKMTQDFARLDLRYHGEKGKQTIIINSCSRDFVFHGQLADDIIFWDYNYSFLPHQNTLPSQVKAYHDGREMLELQAKAAIQFWQEHNPKLK